MRLPLKPSVLVCGLLFNLLNAQQPDPASLLREGRYEDALSAIQVQLRLHPQDPRLLTMQGIALTKQGDDGTALHSYRSALAFSPNYLPALEGAAQIEYRTNDSQTIRHLDLLIALNSNDRTAHAMRAVVAGRSGHCEAAVTDFQAAGILAEQQPDALRLNAACLFRLERWDDAQAVFQKLWALDQRDVRAAYGLASSQIALAHFEEAAVTLQSFPDDAQALALLAQALEELGRIPEAVTALRGAIVRDPKHADLYVQFAELCFTYKSYQAGIDVVNSGLTQLPGASKLYLARGALFAQQGNYELADKDFVKAETLNPQETTSADAAVLTLIQANQLDEAEHVLNAKLKLHPRDAQLFFFLADVLSRKGSFAASTAAARKAVELRPDFVLAHDLLGKLYLQAGDNGNALAQCQAALNTDPQDETALYRWLRILQSNQGDAGSIAQVKERWVKARAKQKAEELRASQYRILTDEQK